MHEGIHATSVIDQTARIGKDVSIGPFCVIGPRAVIGDGCRISSGARIDWARLEPGCYIGANTIVGGDPQIYDWKPVESWVEIGSGTFINELVAVHRSMYEGKSTRIGDNCYIMSQCHIGHDCLLGNEVTVTTLAGLSGHVEVGDYAVIGGAVGIHQFVRIGSMAMIGGMTRLVQDVAPYFTVSGVPAASHGLNSYALRKRKTPPEERDALKKAYKLLTRSGLPVTEAVERIEKELPENASMKILLDFVKSSERGITL